MVAYVVAVVSLSASCYLIYIVINVLLALQFTLTYPMEYKMTKSHLFTSSLLTLSASLLLASNGLADDSYDVKAYGPQSKIVWTTPIKATFEHAIHTRDAGIECSSCHDAIFSMQRGSALKTTKFNMKSMAEGLFCGTCHDGDTAFGTDSNCMACHGPVDEPITWETPVKASFSHKAHVEDFGFECSSCHNDTFTMKKGAAASNKDFNMTSFQEGKYCGTCHNGDDAFETTTQCGSCHYPPTQKIVFDKPVNAVVFDHEVHVVKQKLACESCHSGSFSMIEDAIAGIGTNTSIDPSDKKAHLVVLHNAVCGTCHDSDQPFGNLTKCTVCHVGVKGLSRMNGGDKSEGAHEKSGH